MGILGVIGLNILVSNISVQATTNLLANPDFEQGQGNWLAKPGTTGFDIVTDPVQQGDFAASISSNSKSTKSIIQNISPTEAGSVYTLSGYGYKNDPLAQRIRLRLAWYTTADCSGSQLKTADSNSITTNQDTYIFMTTEGLVAPLEAQCGQVRAQLTPVDGELTTVYFDNLTLTIERQDPPPIEPTPDNPPPDSDTPKIGLVFSEIAWAGTQASSSDEWIEIYNTLTQTVRLAGWSITSDDGLFISLSGSIPPYGYFLLERTDDTTISDRLADQIYTGSLGNDGQQLFLNNGDAVVDSVNIGGGAWPAGQASPQYTTMERIDILLPDRDDNWASNDTVHRNGLDAEGNPINGTPGQANSTTAPPPPIYDIKISELLPRPGDTDWNGDGEGNSEDEWTELTNSHEVDVDIGFWVLKDQATAYRFPAGTIIPAGGFLVVHRTQSKIALNNDEDLLILERADGSVSDAISYHDNPDPGITICRNRETDEWWTYCIPSPGEANIVLPPPAPLSLTIYDVKRVTPGAWVQVTGYVTVPPGIFGRNVMYIQDDTHGIRIRLPSGHGHQFELGDQVEMIGFLANFYSEWQINITGDDSRIRPLEGQRLMTPLPVNSGILGDGYEGLLVQVQIQPTHFEARRRHFWGDDGTGPVRIYVYGPSPISRRHIKRDQPITVVGIVNQREVGSSASRGYRISPRYQFDLIQDHKAPFVAPDPTPPADWPTRLP
ncbi:MAG: lamin tail domain-containing protein [Chloroflexota bacterium]